MSETFTVSLDVMGGDHGPETILAGVAQSHANNPDVRYLLVGDEGQVRPVLESLKGLGSVCDVLHADIAVAMDAKPSQALRSGRRHSSMWKTIEAVKAGEADVAVSAGNTGALMAMSKVILKMAISAPVFPAR